MPFKQLLRVFRPLPILLNRLRAPSETSTTIQWPRLWCVRTMRNGAHYAEVDSETVRAVVEAFANNQISLPRLGNNNALTRIAPGYAAVSSSVRAEDEKTYSIEGLGKFLGWSGKKTENILSPRLCGGFVSLPAGRRKNLFSRGTCLPI